MLWAITGLASLEMLVVHLFVWLKWPLVAWPLTALSALTLLWLIRLIRSLRRCPHRIDEHGLRLRLGTLRSITVPIAQVAGVRTSWESGAARLPGVARMTLIASPNRIVDLGSPIASRRGPVNAVAISVDDPSTFDAAMAARAIRVS